ncbi:double-strand break repair protein AddB [Amorphus orientalis]|uniref:ATP-dependent helicase/nuclease subunit B n=1 Tax=Amorphus orientalis TaxID=649198 RepID=A0AAE3VRC7_9HYPH|nr:double-strand break repair protein AddB [Amorphus orientalis]MDQ0316748.1 ATP-dependent helicase/nuclease subunit B [Amorphus orientalis]
MPRVYSIAPSTPFLPTLVAALRDGSLWPDGRVPDDPLALADATIYLPTRRAARVLEAAFLADAGSPSVVLPDIRAIGDVAEDLLALDETRAADLGQPVLPPLTRRVAMAGLVRSWATRLHAETLDLLPGETVSVPTSPADAARLATDLLDLMDQVETQEADWAALAQLVPEELAAYWQVTTTFLEVAVTAWPDFLAEQGMMEPAQRRRLLVEAEADRLAASRPKGPVIAAGSTGSIPATARLIATIAGLPTGAVVLPGLDFDLDDAAWTAIDDPADPAFSHPQYGLKQLLRRIGIERSDVRALGPVPTGASAARTTLISSAFRPAATTEAWAAPEANAEAAIAGLALIEAETSREEATAIALALRETLETPGATAALVTPDRAIARRVAAEMKRWEIAVDDSAGRPLGTTTAGLFARLAAATATGGDAHTLIALLKHHQCRIGLDHDVYREGVDALERHVLRGHRVRPGSDGLRAAIAHRRSEWADKAKNLAPLDAAETLVDALSAALAPLEDLTRAAEQVAISAFAAAHLAVVEALAHDPARPDALARTADGRALLTALDGLAQTGGVYFDVLPADWPSLFEALAGDAAVRGPVPTDDRLFVWGPLEARLQSVDRLVVAGLNEGSWPAAVEIGPWMSRPMMTAFGLEPPERRIGLAAHDVAQALGARDVVLTRARRVSGTPTVASRWLQRLRTVAGPTASEAIAARGRTYLDWASALDAPSGPPVPAPRPAPAPPVVDRPDRLSVTEIATLIRDPYAIYARHLLRLKPLDPIAPPLEASERGTLIHDVLARFVAEWTGPFDATAVAALVEMGREAFTKLDEAEVAALWLPRFARIAEAFVAREATLATRIRSRLVEIRGRLERPTPAGPVTVAGRADRVDLLSDGTVALYDYKTGSSPSAQEVAAHLEPQLTLEALMLREGGLESVPADQTVSDIAYIELKGAREPLTVRSILDNKAGKDAATLVAEVDQKLRALLSAYAMDGSVYLSRARIQREKSFGGDYDHLARAREWALSVEGGE